VVINVWMNILPHRLCDGAGGNFTPAHPPTKVHGALNQKTTIWNFLSFQLY